MNLPAPLPSPQSLLPADRTPVLVAATGEKAEQRFWEFFTVTIRNPNTRSAYARAAREFCDFVVAGGLTDLGQVQPLHVAAYIEALGKTHAPSTVKLRLAAIRMLFDWLVTGQVVPVNPASAVKGPRYVIKRGKTPVLDRAEARQLLEAIDTESVVGLARSRFHRLADLQLCPGWRGGSHAGRGFLSAGSSLVGAAA